MATLRDGVRAVRNRLGEGKPWLFSVNDIVRDLNLSARAMFSAAQVLQATGTGITSANRQEYALADDVDSIIPNSVKVQIGVLMTVSIVDRNLCQQGALVKSLPLQGYLRKGIATVDMALDPNTVATTEIVNPPPSTHGKMSWILGFYPVPGDAYKFFYDYIALHPSMKNPMDYCLVPDDGINQDTWVAYAVAKGLEKRGDYDGAASYMSIHTAGIEAFKVECLGDQMQINPAIYGGSYPLSERSIQVTVVPPLNPQILNS